MTRPWVTNSGLSRRLGEDVTVGGGKDNAEQMGKLVYFPDAFSVLLPDKSLIPIRSGDIVGLRRGSVLANYAPHFLGYKYLGS